MCWCTPSMRTPWCGKPGCQRPVEPLTLRHWAERMGFPYPLPAPGTPEAAEFLDKVCPPL
jgi:hypothetical protein